MRAVVAANGELHTDPAMLQEWEIAHLRIAADGGANNARESFMAPPHVIIGDMDSLSQLTDRWLTENGVERIKYPRAKDKTDLELAVDLAHARSADEVRVFGALGGRLDQEIANIFLLSTTNCVFEDRRYELRALSARSGVAEISITGTSGETVSLIPITDLVTGIRLDGFVYPLKDETLTRGSTRGVSNVLSMSSGNIRIATGELLIVRLKAPADAAPALYQLDEEI